MAATAAAAAAPATPHHDRRARWRAPVRCGAWRVSGKRELAEEASPPGSTTRPLARAPAAPTRAEIRSHSSGGASTPALAMRPVTSQCSATSAAHRGHSVEVGGDRPPPRRGRRRRARRRREAAAISSWFMVSVHAASTPCWARAVRSRRSPLRIRLFTVPSGWPRSDGHLAVGVPVEVGHLDGGALVGRQARHRRLHLFGDGQVPRLVLDVVARRPPSPGRCAPRVGGVPTPSGRCRRHARGPWS